MTGITIEKNIKDKKWLRNSIERRAIMGWGRAPQSNGDNIRVAGRQSSRRKWRERGDVVQSQSMHDLQACEGLVF